MALWCASVLALSDAFGTCRPSPTTGAGAGASSVPRVTRSQDKKRIAKRMSPPMIQAALLLPEAPERAWAGARGGRMVRGVGSEEAVVELAAESDVSVGS